ncbi:VOC family protein [Actinomadura fibrosa]|uniref:VOC family protein n=1 Tax=Actinomadura fibrosa TaxID=111802 RepID=A0ABW2XX79_9ACTN|nr:VOC family protein [Actinomadura fibrosa]
MLDAPDPRALAGFYRRLLGSKVVADSAEWVAHLDIEVDDLDAAGARAEAEGAVLADFQPQEHVRVYLDPAGHPFCLFLPGA